MGFLQLHSAWAGKIKTMANRVNIKGYEAEDICQELAIVLWKCWKDYDGSAAFSTYFYTAARNRIGALKEKAGAMKRSYEEVCIEELAEVLADNRVVDFYFQIELRSYIQDEKVMEGIALVLEGGDPEGLPRKVYRNIRTTLSNYYTEERVYYG